MPRFACGSCRAPLEDGDRHVICALCLGLEHAELALADGGCDLCENLPLSSLRARLLAVKTAPAPPLSSPRKKKRRAQRPPEPPAEPCGPPPPPPASRSPSPPQPDIQLPPSGRSVASDDAAEEKDSCSLLASDSEEWSSLGSTRESAGIRAGIEEELMRLLSQAVERLGLEWSPPPEQAPNRMDGSFFHRRSTPACNRAAPFLPELHAELTKSWNAPLSARNRSDISASLRSVDGAAEKGYSAMPPVEDLVAAHLCPPSARWRSSPTLPSKACRATSSFHARAYTAAGQAASALHSMSVLQVLQSDILREWAESGRNPSAVTDLRSATDLALRATKAAAQALGRCMASLCVSERHLWLTLTDMGDSERAAFLNAPLSPSGLFGSAVTGIVDRFSEVQKATQAMNLFLPRRASSSAGRSREPPARAPPQRPPLQTQTAQRRQGGRPRSRSDSRRRPPPPRGPRPKITLMPDRQKSA
jgi:LSD1 subclass zinc finger protein